MSSSSDEEIDSRQFLILYATESGNAIDVAQKIRREGQRRHFQPRIASVDEYPAEDLISEPLVVFVISTTGTGVEPRSMTKLWTMLIRADLPSDLFEGMEYAVFGLGDSAYEKFCWAAKKLDRRLEGLGAERMVDRGEGDEQHPQGVNGALDGWIDKLYEQLLNRFPLDPGLEILPSNYLWPPAITAVINDSPPSTSLTSSPALPHRMTVRVNERITDPDWFQEVRHIELDSAEPLDFKPGDVAVIYPEALDEDVDAFLHICKWSNIADDPLDIEIHDQSFWPVNRPLPSHTTLRELAKSYLDINAVPRRSFFEAIRHFAPDELERSKLEEFCTTEGQEDLYDYCQKVRRTITEVLEEFRSVTVPLERLFDVVPPMRPRQFSIASSIKKYPKQVHLCVAIVKYKTRLRKVRKGTCTAFLSRLPIGSTLFIDIQPGSLRLPRNVSTPIICIAPGTGVAPMRAVLQDRVAENHHDNLLYFGCRSSVKDQHYAEEWRAMNDASQITFRIACSRDGPVGVARVYVQDKIKEEKERIGRMIVENGAWIYISGSSNKMPQQVKQALAECVLSTGLKDGEEEQIKDVNTIMRQLELEGRLLEECWS